jgi:hypothetical protein
MIPQILISLIILLKNYYKLTSDEYIWLAAVIAEYLHSQSTLTSQERCWLIWLLRLDLEFLEDFIDHQR